MLNHKTQSALLRVSYPVATALFMLVTLVACTAAPDKTAAPAADAPPITLHGAMRSCLAGPVLLDAYFAGGELGVCETGGAGEFMLSIHPEDAPPINVSPWYAFRVSGAAGDKVNVTVTFPEGFARYWPKVSNNGRDWLRLDSARVDKSEEGVMRLALELNGPQLWVAAQPLLTADYFQRWNETLDQLPFATTTLHGHSLEGRPIYGTETDGGKEFVLIVGRQHPPEVTGTLTMRPFLDELMGDSALAEAFRAHYKLLIYPVLNPDGVHRGHWRHNEGGVDLNRDWGPFSQPETRLVRTQVDALVAGGIQPRLMLDFHSTGSNLFYTQLPSETTEPLAFATRWLTASRARLPDYDFKHDPRGISERPTTKNYFYKRFAIPAITYETGDETDPADIESSARVFAQEMMRLMLEYADTGP